MMRAFSWRRRPRIWTAAGVAFAATAASLFLRPEPTDSQVLRLLKELHGTPMPRFGMTCRPRRHEAIFADLERLGAAAMPGLVSVAKEHPEATMRHLAVAQLGRLGDRRAVPHLIESLDDPTVGVDIAAAAALGELGERAAVGPLTVVLASDQSNLRAVAAAALGKIGDRRAFEALVPLVVDGELCVRASAVKALSRLNDPRGLAPLVAALQHDESAWVRSLAIEGLVHLENVRSVPALRAARQDPSLRVQEDAHLALSLIGQTDDAETQRVVANDAERSVWVNRDGQASAIH